jgi:ribosome biogenesis GTPase A
MAIGWYPGHMVTARKDAVVAMRKTDVVVEVLDARVPLSSCNPTVEVLRRENQRPALKVLNKADLADPTRTAAWLRHYNAQPGVKALALSAKRASEVRRILPACEALVPGRGTPAKPLRMMILGIPNVGKSTVMNALLGRVVARVADEPGITKSHMRHQVSPNVWLVDTPGLMWPGVPQDVVMKLAITDSVGRNAYDAENVAVALGGYLLAHYRDACGARYGDPAEGCDGLGLLGLLARRRNFVLKGGAPDTGKAARVLLDEFRAGLLGRISLETVEGAGARRTPALAPPGDPPRVP